MCAVLHALLFFYLNVVFVLFRQKIIVRNLNSSQWYIVRVLNSQNQKFAYSDVMQLLLLLLVKTFCIGSVLPILFGNSLAGFLYFYLLRTKCVCRVSTQTSHDNFLKSGHTESIRSQWQPIPFVQDFLSFCLCMSRSMNMHVWFTTNA